MANQEQVELLKQGAEVWNQWREDHSRVQVDLYEADFHGADLRGANLYGANLIKANLSSTDLSSAQLWRAFLIEANLSSANLSSAILTEATLAGANFTKAILANAILIDAKLVQANLSSANLNNADLGGANLNSASLNNASLIHTSLTYSQLLGSDLTSANLTGACIWNWHISNLTQLDDVICEYVYQRSEWSQEEQKDLLSDHRSFAPGEFTALFEKALETVDLIFADGINWQAFFQSFQELRSQYDDLSIQAIEKKSGGAFIVRLEVPAESDKAEIESQAKELYEIKLQLQEQRYRAELQAKNGQISLYQEQLEFHRQNDTNLMEIVKTMAEKENQPTHQTIINAQTIGATHTGSGDITHFTQNINSNIDDITKLITTLRDSAQSLPEAQREEVLVHLDDLQEDLNQPEKQKPSRLKTRLVALFAIASTASGVVVGATDFGNKVLDLSKKLGIELVHPQSNQQLPPSK